MTLLVAGRLTPTNVGLLEAAREVGLDAALMPIEDAAARARPGDVLLPRLDVLESLDGMEPGLWLLPKVASRDVRVLNGGTTLIATHDKLVTALRLARAGIPHPRTAHVEQLSGRLGMSFPVVVKPRFGSWGKDVVRCETQGQLEERLERMTDRPWFARQGALVQELIPPRGYDMRVLVAGGCVVGAIRRVAAPGEWRTNVALGGHREPAAPPPEARALALAAARAIGGDLVGVDLLPTPSGWTVLELNGCVDFTDEYGLFGGDPFVEVVCSLDRAVRIEQIPALAGVD